MMPWSPAPCFLFGGAYDALVDVGRLSWMAESTPHELPSNLVFAAGVADAVDDPARHALYVDVGFRAHFARHDDESRRAERFAGDLGACVVTQEFVQDGVRNLIRDFVGVSFRHRFRRE